MSVFLSNINLAQNELQNAVIQNLAIAPANPINGQIYYNTGDNTVYFYNNSTWVNIVNGIQNILDDGSGYLDINILNKIATIGLNIATIDHDLLLNTGLNSHAAIDSHIATTANPHSVTLEAARLAGSSLSGSIDMGGFTINNIGDAIAASDVVSKSQLDSALSGLSWKAPVDELATAPTGNEVGIDGFRVLINGIATGLFVGQDNTIATWDNDLSSWSFTQPIANDSVFDKATDLAFTYNLDAFSWIQFSGAGQINAGAGLVKDGTTINLISANKGLTVNADDVEVSGSDIAGLGLEADLVSTWKINVKSDTITGATIAPISATSNGLGTEIDNLTIVHTAGVLKVDGYTPVSGTTVTTKYVTSIVGTGTGQTYQIVHNLNTQNVTVSVRDTTTNELVYMDMVATTATRVDIIGAGINGRTYYIVVIG